MWIESGKRGGRGKYLINILRDLCGGMGSEGFAKYLEIVGECGVGC